MRGRPENSLGREPQESVKRRHPSPEGGDRKIVFGNTPSRPGPRVGFPLDLVNTPSDIALRIVPLCDERSLEMKKGAQKACRAFGAPFSVLIAGLLLDYSSATRAMKRLCSPLCTRRRRLSALPLFLRMLFASEAEPTNVRLISRMTSPRWSPA